MKRYPSYRNSDVPWLGQIPKHWKISRGKWLYRKMERPVRPEDEVVTAFRDGTVTLRKNRRLDGFTNSLLEIGYQGIRKGDLVIHAMDAFAGAIGVSDSDGKSTPVYSACVPKNDEHPVYFCRLLRSMSQSGYIEALARGIRERSSEFRFDQFANLDYPVPPRPEQDAIVAFLEAKEKNIGTFIANKRRMIELLKEQKTTLINHAVTRGLNPNVPHKPSGIPRLGDIPKHWDVRRNKYLFREVNNRSETGTETKLSMSQKHGLIPTSEMEERSTQSASFEGHKICDVGDLVLNKLKAHLGVFAVARQRGLVSPDYTVLRPIVRMNVCYYDFLFHTPAFVASFKGASTGMVEGFLRLYTDQFGRLSSMFPSVEEQDAIVRYIDEESRNIAAAIAAAEQEIELMEEYHTALTAAAVTGKIDVRETTKTVMV